MHVNERVEIEADNDRIIIKRINKKHKTLEERLAGLPAIINAVNGINFILTKIHFTKYTINNFNND